jgi:2-amino-4-hydroxy-6-hydroxymethyldihydropteridine diphosphokinase
MIRCFIGLGSNLREPQTQLQSALKALGAVPLTRLTGNSSFYCSAAIGPGEQPDYINAVAELETTLDAQTLLDHLQAIEVQHGRERSLRWGARTLDLDILLFGNEQIDSPRLTVPHPRMAERNFVLQPLAELQPDLQLPDGKTVSALLLECPHNRLQKL